jgi:ATP-binding cassette subfamily F protein 3
MHLLSLVADRLWLVKDGRVTPYDDDLEAYRKLLLDVNSGPQKAEKPVKKKRASRDEILALRAEVRKCEDRVEKLQDMAEKLSKKLSDPALYGDDKIGELEVWNRKYAEVREAMERAETLWMRAQDKLDTAETQGA